MIYPHVNFLLIPITVCYNNSTTNHPLGKLKLNNLPEICKKNVINFAPSMWIEGETMDRKEAISLLSELGANQLICPSFVILEPVKAGSYQLKIRGNYNLHEIGNFLKSQFSVEEIRNFLVICSQ